MTTQTPIIMYAARRQDGSFNNIYPVAVAVKMCGCQEPVQVAVEINEEGTYWGFFEDNRIKHVQTAYVLLDMCFPAGVKGAEEAGRGKAVRLSITALESPEQK